ncbi:flavin monoamine oxidase family protein [Salinarimonas ramus]|uniref:Tryptophan 2-monooxygenase n=1 Tax=Salinarimonas ramus TaxID=690164 RepID=A0A917QAN4_9HYPH|nr:FAD-dependent oxidoreductase [Salinarimonas ramus]GGK40732.1 amine oxidase [Salinarimonas ramus]
MRRARVAPPPRAADVAILGAGAAGIAAARRLLATGLSVVLIEARERVGGRALTARLAGQAVDIGAHWLHAAQENGLVEEARRLGLPLFDAPQEPRLVVGAREADAAETRAFHAGWSQLAEAIQEIGAKDDLAPASAALERLSPEAAAFAGTLAFAHGPFACGATLDSVGAADFAAARDDLDLFVAGGYGALVARLADGLPVALATRATRVDWSGREVRIETNRGDVHARALVVTVPVPVLARGDIVFDPPLPAGTRDALHALRPASYEHVILAWPGGPLREAANTTIAFDGDPADNLGLLANFDGGVLHYADLGGPLVGRLGSPAARADFVRESLAARFGREAVAGLRVLHASRWGEDPLSACAWMVAPPGAHGARAVLREPVGGRVLIAGEATSSTLWGTIGGAYAEGERAARDAATLVGGIAAGARIG